MGQAFLFYLFATVSVASALGVIVGRNPVHSVLFLILTFLNAAGLFMLAHAELLALLLVIVYVGAVAVLFLFVVMMLDINFKELRQGISCYTPIGLLIGGIFAVELALVVWMWKITSSPIPIEGIGEMAPTNAHAIGKILYTDYFLLFQISGAILLVAMIGAIVLTHRQRSQVRKQDPRQQVLRTVEQTLEICKVESRKGMKRS
jgi:NADH-quinone oxidoreductase subunit J